MHWRTLLLSAASCNSSGLATKLNPHYITGFVDGEGSYFIPLGGEGLVPILNSVAGRLVIKLKCLFKLAYMKLIVPCWN